MKVRSEGGWYEVKERKSHKKKIIGSKIHENNCCTILARNGQYMRIIKENKAWDCLHTTLMVAIIKITS